MSSTPLSSCSIGGRHGIETVCADAPGYFLRWDDHGGLVATLRIFRHRQVVRRWRRRSAHMDITIPGWLVDGELPRFHGLAPPASAAGWRRPLAPIRGAGSPSTITLSPLHPSLTTRRPSQRAQGDRPPSTLLSSLTTNTILPATGRCNRGCPAAAAPRRGASEHANPGELPGQ